MGIEINIKIEADSSSKSTTVEGQDAKLMSSIFWDHRFLVDVNALLCFFLLAILQDIFLFTILDSPGSV